MRGALSNVVIELRDLQYSALRALVAGNLSETATGAHQTVQDEQRTPAARVDEGIVALLIGINQ